MQTESVPANTNLQSPAPTRYRGAIWTLLILAPVISEVLSGSTRLSILFVLIPEVMVWGGGALLCRELVRRWHAGATSLLLLGLALSVAEEFIIQQTSIAPLPFPGANAAYGRYLGVNWVYFLFMLGFESVWVVLVPVQVTELIFPVAANNPGSVNGASSPHASHSPSARSWLGTVGPSRHARVFTPRRITRQSL